MTTQHLIVSRQFLPLFLAQFLEAFNINFFKNALFILVTYQSYSLLQDHTLDPNALINAGGALLILPFLLFSPIAGQLADKFDKSKMVKLIKGIELILIAIIGIGFATHNLWLILSLLFLLGTHGTFISPVKYAILPNLLKENDLIQANAWIEAGTFLAILLGTLLGGIIILKENGVFLMMSILACTGILGWCASWFIPATKPSVPSLKIDWNIFRTTWQIVSHTIRDQRLMRSIMGISWLWYVGVTFLAIFPLFVKNVLHADNYVVTLFLALFSIGIAVGSLICSRLMREEIHVGYIPFACFGMTIFVVDLYFASHYFLIQEVAHLNVIAQNHSNTLLTITDFLHHAKAFRVMMDLFLTAVSAGIYVVPLYTILQISSQEQYRARVLACNNIFNAVFMVLSAGITWWLLKKGVTESELFLIIGLFNAAVALYIIELIPDSVIKVFLRWCFKTFYRAKIEGLKHFKEAGDRVVIIANHTSLLDAALIAAFLPEKIIFAINTQIATRWWIKPFLLLVEAYPMDPTNPMAIKSLIKTIKQNKKCIIFPEGRITMTGTLMKIYEGPGVVADKADAKILPIRIDGAQYSAFSYLRGKVRIRLFPKITLTILPAEKMQVSDALSGRERRHFIGLKLYDQMTDMVFRSSDHHITLFESLLNGARIHGRHHVIAEDIEFKPMSYQKLILSSFVLGRTLCSSTVPREYVGLLLPNMISTVVMFFGLQAFGRVPAMLNFTSGAKNILAACHNAQIQQVYTSRQFIEKARLENVITVLKEASIKIIYLEDLKAQITLKNKMIGKIASFFPTIYYHLVNRTFLKKEGFKEPAVVLFTSGSEGNPKGVVLSHSNIQANRFQLGSVIDFGPTDKIFNALPIFHAFGLTGGMLLPLSFGVKMFLYPSPLHYRMIPDMVYFTDATIMFGTDTFLKNYGKYANPYDFYSMRYVFAGAEKLKESTYKLWLEKFGIRIFEGYGATETSPVLSINTPMHNRFGTVGRFLPGIHAEFDPIPGVQPGGQLRVYGPNIMLGYLLSDAPGQLKAPEGGYYNTGDIVSEDNEGYLTILGRVKRFAKIAGEMVSLSSVEDYLHLLWPHCQHAIIAIPDEKKGEQLVLITEFEDAKREEISSYARRENITELFVPKVILIMKKLPLLGTGKVDYVKVKEWALDKIKP